MRCGECVLLILAWSRVGPLQLDTVPCRCCPIMVWLCMHADMLPHHCQSAHPGSSAWASPIGVAGAVALLRLAAHLVVHTHDCATAHLPLLTVVEHRCAGAVCGCHDSQLQCVRTGDNWP
jgi:hypothetical protein